MINLNKTFFDNVFDVARLIPFGRVTTYGAIAKSIGSPNGARMVGWAMSRSRYEKSYVPAHRVVNRNGMLTGKHHFSTAKTMEEKLKEEGIEVVSNKIINFKELFWNPVNEIDIT